MAMALGREQIYATIVAQLTQVLLFPAGPFQYIGRRPVPIGTLALEQYPALILMESAEEYMRHTLFAPAKVILTMVALIQALDGVVANEESVAVLNNLADAVEDALQSYCGPTAQNVLGGLSQRAWIEGRQNVIPASYPQKFSEQYISIKIVLPHSR